MDQQLQFVVNPAGADTRSEERVWNSGDQRTKLVNTSIGLSGFYSLRLQKWEIQAAFCVDQSDMLTHGLEVRVWNKQDKHTGMVDTSTSMAVMIVGVCTLQPSLAGYLNLWESDGQAPFGTLQITISPKEEEAPGGRLRSRMAQSAIRETLGSSGGPQRKSLVMDAPLKVSSNPIR